MAIEAPGTPKPGEGWSIIDLRRSISSARADQHTCPSRIQRVGKSPVRIFERDDRRTADASDRKRQHAAHERRDHGARLRLSLVDACARAPTRLSPVPLPRISVFRPSNHGAEGPPSFHGRRRARCRRYPGAYRQTGPRGRTQRIKKVMASGGAMTPGSLPEETVFRPRGTEPHRRGGAKPSAAQRFARPSNREHSPFGDRKVRQPRTLRLF